MEKKKRQYTQEFKKEAVEYSLAPHSPDGNEGGKGDKSVRTTDIAPVLGFNVPYRSMILKTVEGLLVTGRCISQTHEADGFTRLQSCCMAMGQAVGTAAALAVKKRFSLSICSIQLKNYRRL